MNDHPHVKKVLVLAANPLNTSRLRLDEEVREITEGLRRAKQHDYFSLMAVFATRPKDIHRALLDYQPHIVHFSGHGEGESGILLENDAGTSLAVTAEALANLFALFNENNADKIDCVLLNACYSEVQAAAIVQHVPYVIGMQHGIDDTAALHFAVGFYDALGAGKSIEFAYKLGCSAIQMAGIAGHLTPKLKINPQHQEPADFSNEPNNLFATITSYVPQASCDVFVSYAPLDNEPLPGAEQGWVTTLVEGLRKLLMQKLGRVDACHIWMDDTTRTVHALPPAHAKRLENTALFLLISSPSYFAATGCCQEYETFLQQTPQHSNRIFLVEHDKLTYPKPLQGVLSYPFWKLDKTTGRVRTLALPKPNPDREIEYYQYLDDIASDITEKLGNLKTEVETELRIEEEKRKQMQQPLNMTESSKLLFINAYTDDKNIAQLIGELASHQHSIFCLFPSESGSPEELRQDLEGNLSDCDAVLLLYGNSSNTWVRAHLRQSIKIAGQRLKKPLVIVCSLPPEPKMPLNVSLPPYVNVWDCTHQSPEEIVTNLMNQLKNSPI